MVNLSQKLVRFLKALFVPVETDLAFPQSPGDDLVQAVEGAAADEENVRRVDFDVFLQGMLPAALRRHVGDRSLHDLEERLLDALAGNVPRDGNVVASLSDLVDLIDVNYAPLRLGHVEVGVLQKLKDDVLNVLAYVAGLGERRGVRDGERHVHHPGQRLGQKRFARAGRAYDEHIAFVQFYVAVILCGSILQRPCKLGLTDGAQMRHEPEVMGVDRDRDGAFGRILADDVLVEVLLDLLRRPQLHFLVESRILADDGSAGAGAGTADENVVIVETGDQGILFGRLPAAKGAERHVTLRFFRITGAHFSSPAFSTTLSIMPYDRAS